MSAAIAIKEPTSHQAGDSLVFTKTLADYPASLWTLSYALRITAGGTPITITATASGSDFAVNVTAATTALWTPGIYTIIGYVSNATERYTVYQGNIEITLNVATTDNLDGRTYWERVRDKLRDVIENGVIREVIRYTYNGVSTEVQSMEDAFKALAIAESKVLQEQSGGKVQKIHTRFVSAR